MDFCIYLLSLIITFIIIITIINNVIITVSIIITIITTTITITITISTYYYRLETQGRTHLRALVAPGLGPLPCILRVLLRLPQLQQAASVMQRIKAAARPCTRFLAGRAPPPHSVRAAEVCRKRYSQLIIFLHGFKLSREF